MTQSSEVVDLACRLIGIESVSPEDGGCQQIIRDMLAPIGFSCEAMPFEDVSNLWATHGHGDPILVFAGHTDVVPPGPLAQWSNPPFTPVVENGILHGRGAADMKGSLAAMLIAARRFVAAHPDHAGTLGFLITSDEEAVARNGTRRVIETLTERDTFINWCVIGEPSSSERLGDIVRIGRRGSLNARLTVKGIQGHVAYPLEARNPIHEALPALAELVAERWDDGNEHFPATSMQVSNVTGGTGANNVIPGTVDFVFNFRFSTESTADSLKARTTAILDAHELDYDIDWALSGAPFLTTGDTLVNAVQAALTEHAGDTALLSTSGGTSDGRFISPAGAEVVELGPSNATIHRVNEHVAIEEIEQLTLVYEGIMQRLLPDAG